MKNYTITVNGNVYDVTVEENTNGAPAAAPAPRAAAPAPAPAAKPAAAGTAGSISITAGAASWHGWGQRCRRRCRRRSPADSAPSHSYKTSRIG